jgi:succinate-acetate transporter protein
MTDVTLPAQPGRRLRGDDASARSTAGSQPQPVEPGIARPRMSNPMPIAFGLFAFALTIYGIRFVDVNATTLSAGPASEALTYAVLAAGIAQVLAGVLGVIRGQAFQGYVMATFGIWLFGLFMLFTQGAAQKAFTPDAVGWYALVLLVPVCIMAVPEFVERNVPVAIAFVAIIVLLLLLGLGYHDLYGDLTSAVATKRPPAVSGVVDMLKISAYCAFVAAAAIWYVMARDLYRIMGIVGTVPPYVAR